MRKKLNSMDVIHVDKNTGEVICETSGCTSIEDETLTESEKKHKEYVDTHVLNFNKGDGFVKMFTEMAYALSLKLPAKEYQVAIGLSKFVSYEDNILKIGTGKRKHNMDLHEIADAMQTDYSRMTRIMNSLIKHGVFGIMQVGNCKTKNIEKYYIANPYVYINGKNPETELCKYFDNSGWKEFVEEISTLNQVC